jgi:hypothetical protein
MRNPDSIGLISSSRRGDASVAPCAIAGRPGGEIGACGPQARLLRRDAPARGRSVERFERVACRPHDRRRRAAPAQIRGSPCGGSASSIFRRIVETCATGSTL